MEHIKNCIEKMKSEDLLHSGFIELDKIIYSFEKSNLYILAGNPGMGKTAFGLNIVYNIAVLQKRKVAVVSYEMTESQVISRLLSIGTDIPNYLILRCDYDESVKEIISQKAIEIQKSDIFIDCPAILEFNNLRSNLERLIKETGIEFIFIDDVQRISISEKERQYAANREQEVSKNVRDLKAFAKEFRIPILAISQLNRNNKDRLQTTPILSDIRDSGAIENDSDVVIFVNRPECYGFNEDEDGNSLHKIAVFEIAKNRHGFADNFKLMFEKESSSFHSCPEPYSSIELDSFSLGELSYKGEVPF